MADSIKYKYADNDLDLKTYIHNLNTNLNSYIDSRVRDYGWNEGQVLEFRNSFDRYLGVLQDLLDNNTGRLSTNVHGTITDKLGELDNTDLDDYRYDKKGNQISREDFDKLKARKQKRYTDFSGNSEFARYAHLIAQGVANNTKPETSTSTDKYNPSKHDFVYWWQNIKNPNGDAHSIDAYLDLDAVDATTGKRARTNRAKKAAEFINEYSDWLKSKNLDYTGQELDYDLRAARLKTLADAWGNGTWDVDDLTAANQAGISSLWTNGFFTENPRIDTTTEELLKQAAEKKKAEEDAAKKAWFDEQYGIYKGNAGQYNSDDAFDLGTFDIKTNDQIAESLPVQTDYKKLVDDWLANPFVGKDNTTALNVMINSQRARLLEDGTYYIPSDSDKKTNRALIYNPTNGKLYYTFIGDVKDEWEKIKQKHFTTDDNRYGQYMKNGGTVQEFQDGGNFDYNRYMEEQRKKGFEERGKVNGRTAKQQEAGERGINSAKQSMQDPNAGFTGVELTRLGAIAGDLSSAFIGIVGGNIASSVVGAGATTANLAADVVDDSVSGWEAFKNAAFGYGMDLVGAIPVVGATGKFAKIAKSAYKLAPKVMTVLGGLSGMAHAKEYYNSWAKIGNDEKMTVDDWKNIAASIQLLAGGTAAVARLKAVNKAYKTKSDTVAMDFVDPKTGAKQTRIFEGPDAKAIIDAKGNVASIKQATIDKFEDLKGLDLDVKGTKEGFTIPIIKKTIGAKEGSVEVLKVVPGKNGEFIERGWKTPDQFTTGIKRGGVDATEAEITRQMQPLIDRNKIAASAISKKDVKIADLQGKVANLEEAIRAANAAYTGRSAAELLAKLDRYSPKSRSKKVNKIRKLLAIALQHELSIAGMQLKIENLRKRISTWQNADSYRSNLRNSFESRVKDGNIEFTMPSGSTVTRDWSELLLKYGGLKYKQGGIIPKYAGGRDIRKSPNWYDNMFSTDINNYVSGQSFTGAAAKLKFIDDFNNRQKQWRTNYTAAVNNGWKPQGSVSYDKNVWDYLGGWQGLGLNKGIEAFNQANAGVHNTAKGYGDVKDSWQDGYFGSQEFIRHGGSADSWKGREAELKDFLNKLAKLGLTYTLDNNTNMYMLGAAQNPESPVATTETKYNPEVNKETYKPAERARQFMNTGWFLGLDRLLGTLAFNEGLRDSTRKIHRIVDAETPFEINRYAMSDLDAELRGKNAAALLNHQADIAITPDIDKQMGLRFEAGNKGLEHINQGLETSNAASKANNELAWLQMKENALDVHRVRTLNGKSFNNAQLQIAIGDQIIDKANHDALDTKALELEYKHEQNKAEHRDLQDRFAMLDILDTIKLNLKQYDNTVTPQEEAMWNRINNGLQYSSLTKADEQALFRSVWDKAARVLADLTRQHYGIPASPWANVRRATSRTPWTMLYTAYKKKGGTVDEKIRVQKLKNRSKDNETFHKNVNKNKDRFERALDRIAKYRRG